MFFEMFTGDLDSNIFWNVYRDLQTGVETRRQIQILVYNWYMQIHLSLLIYTDTLITIDIYRYIDVYRYSYTIDRHLQISVLIDICRYLYW